MDVDLPHETKQLINRIIQNDADYYCKLEETKEDFLSFKLIKDIDCFNDFVKYIEYK